MIKAFRIVGWLEGISYLLLLGVGVPLKYIGGNPAAVKALGMPHGILFILYVILAFKVYAELDWPKKLLFRALVAALLPFGTIYFDFKILRKVNI
jgi:integral membrane protein